MESKVPQDDEELSTMVRSMLNNQHYLSKEAVMLIGRYMIFQFNSMN